jgi:hypothetical protein
MVTMETFAPVASWKALTTFWGILAEDCAAQKVSSTPSSLSVAEGQEARAPMREVARAREVRRVTGVVRAVGVRFMRFLHSCGVIDAVVGPDQVGPGSGVGGACASWDGEA